jgi:glycosyltransferase involved in cell wall biosynthesis
VIVGIAVGRVNHHLEQFLKSNESIRKTRYIPVDCGSGSPLYRQYNIARLVNDIKPDVVLPLRVYDAMVAIANDRRRKYRVIYSLHEYREHYIQDIVTYKSIVDKVVVFDELARRAVLQIAGMSPENVITIPHGVGVVSKGSRKTVARPIRIGYAGRLERSQKRSQDLVGLCDHLDGFSAEYTLSVAGKGEEEESLRAALDLRVSQGKVKFLGWLSSEELKNYFYPYIDLLIITSTRETGPLVAFEAMMHGVVVVTARYRGLDAAGFLVHGKNCLLFEVGDMETAASHIRSVIEDAALFSRLSEEGCRASRSQRDIDGMADSWISLMAELVRQDPVKHYVSHSLSGTYKSRLESLPLPIGVVERIRGLFRKRFNHASPGEEWPFYSVPREGLKEELEVVLEAQDNSSEMKGPMVAE